MVAIYVRWIQDPAKNFTTDNVPKRWREAVRAALEENNTISSN